MKTLLVSLLSILLLTSYKSFQNADKKMNAESFQPTQVQTLTFNFDNYDVGKMPAGWSNHFTGKGNLGSWKILNDKDTKVLAQTSSKNFGYHFDVIVNDELKFKDVEIEVKIKGFKGEEDQGGGPVWRYQDADNYYIARANPLENNYRVYKVINGNRKQLKSIDLKINSGQWYTLKITMKGDEIKCYFDGKLMLEARDDSFPNAGKIGVWTKADAVTYFDDLSISG